MRGQSAGGKDIKCSGRPFITNIKGSREIKKNEKEGRDESEREHERDTGRDREIQRERESERELSIYIAAKQE